MRKLGSLPIAFQAACAVADVVWEKGHGDVVFIPAHCRIAVYWWKAVVVNKVSVSLIQDALCPGSELSLIPSWLAPNRVESQEL